MSKTPIVFRGVKGRTGNDQIMAMERGYNSVMEMAVDDLGEMVLELTQRVEELEGRATDLERTDRLGRR